MLYLCIHDVHLLGLHYLVALRRREERRGKGGIEKHFGILYVRMLPYWLKGLVEIKDSLGFSH